VSELPFYLEESVPTEVGRQLRSSGIDAVPSRTPAPRRAHEADPPVTHSDPVLERRYQPTGRLFLAGAPD
jgi:hypothetical protein